MRRWITVIGLIVTAWSLVLLGAGAVHAAESPAPGENQGNNQGNNQGGNPPSIAVKSANLVATQPGSVTVALVGGDIPEGDANLPITIGVSVDNGTIAAGGGSPGASASVTGPFSQLRAGVTFTVIPERDGPITFTVVGSPVDRPQDAISSRESAQVAPAPAPSPSPTPTPSPEPTVASAAPATTQAAEPAPASTKPQPAPQPTTKTPDLPAYDPADEPQQVVDTTVTAVAVIGVVGVGAAAVAGGTLPIGGAAPGSSGTPTGGSTPSGDSRTIAAERRHDQVTADRYAAEDHSRAQGSLANIDAAEHIPIGASGPDRAGAVSLPMSGALNAASVALATRVAALSPLTARLVIENAYLRAVLGSGALLLPITGIVLGIIGALQVGGVAIAPSVTLVALIAFLGTLDALTGLLAFLAFTIGVVVSGGVVNVDSIRTLLGLLVIGCGPALIAGAARPIRRARGSAAAWERLTDFVVIPLLGAFAVQGMVRALPGLSGYAMPIAQSANLIALVVLVGLLARISLEELVARGYPGRLAAAMPVAVAAPRTAQRLVVAGIRTIVFLFVAVAFIGNCWQLWFGAALFAATQLCDILASRMPNSPALFHAVPAGLPKLIVILLASLGIGTLLTLVLGEDADLARTSFALLIVPGFILAAFGMFGREPRPGDTRWYLRDSMRTLYRIGGILMLAIGIALTQFV